MVFWIISCMKAIKKRQENDESLNMAVYANYARDLINRCLKKLNVI